MNRTVGFIVVILLGCFILGIQNVFSQESSETQTVSNIEELNDLASENLTTEIEQIRKHYPDKLLSIVQKKEQLKQRYVQTEDKQAIIKHIHNSMMQWLAEDLFPAWMGTPWDFNGSAQMPGEDPIACGVFVTTILRDLGFNIPRIQMARQPAEHIIKNLCPKNQIKRFSNKKINVIEEYITQSGEGLYIVGLDSHVGFIMNWNDKQTFVHSSYYYPPGSVVAEKLDGFNPLNHSGYRVIGKLFDAALITKWILNKPISMKYDYFAQ